MQIELYGDQIQGQRLRQEDAFLVAAAEDGWLALLADGLGGHPAGDRASHEAVEKFRDVFQRSIRGVEGPGAALKEALLAADQRLRDIQEQDATLLGMATTLVALYIEEGRAAALSVGDSYLLLLRDGALQRLNELHAADGGLTSCVGFHLAQVDLAEEWEVRVGDRFLLASDGLLSITEGDIVKALAGPPTPQEAVEALLGAVRDRNHPHQDNVTLVTAFVSA